MIYFVSFPLGSYNVLIVTHFAIISGVSSTSCFAMSHVKFGPFDKTYVVNFLKKTTTSKYKYKPHKHS